MNDEQQEQQAENVKKQNGEKAEFTILYEIPQFPGAEVHVITVNVDAGFQIKLG